MAGKDTDLQKIKELIEIMKDNDLLEIEIKHGDDKIFLKRSGPYTAVGGPMTTVPESPKAGGVPAAPAAAEALSQPSAPQKQEELLEIKSPIVGTFYATASPDSTPYVEVGSHVNPQPVVGIIEAMKVMNEIKAEISGTIVEIPVTNGQAVEYGQVLFKVRPD